MCPSTGSRSLLASSESRSANRSIEPFRSAKSAVTCLRSPSIEPWRLGSSRPGAWVCRPSATRSAELWETLLGPPASRVSALRAKLGNRGKLGTAVGARALQGSGALLAEPCTGAIFVAALRTLHRKPFGAAGGDQLGRSLRHAEFNSAGSALNCWIGLLPLPGHYLAHRLVGRLRATANLIWPAPASGSRVPACAPRRRRRRRRRSRSAPP